CVIKHRMWPIKETANLCFVAENLKTKGKYLCDSRQTVAFLGGQGLLVPPAALQRRLGHHAIGEAASIVRADPARDAIKRRNRQSLLHGIGQRQRRLSPLRPDAQQIMKDGSLITHGNLASSEANISLK